MTPDTSLPKHGSLGVKQKKTLEAGFLVLEVGPRGTRAMQE